MTTAPERALSQDEQIDAYFHKGGILTLARGAHQLPLIREAYAGYERLGLSSQYHLMSAEEARQRVNVTEVHGAPYASENASVHPGRLVRGLARAIEQHGAVIYERTEVTDFAGGAAPRLLTPGGELRAKKALVLAGEAYLTRLSKLHRALLPVYSLKNVSLRTSQAFSSVQHCQSSNSSPAAADRSLTSRPKAPNGGNPTRSSPEGISGR